MPTTNPEWRNAFSIVGEIVLLASALDYQLTHLVIEILNLTKSTMLEPIVSTLDTARKLEIVKGRVRHVKQSDWRKPVEKYIDKVERVFRARNIACHSQMVRDKGRFEFSSSQAAKLFKGLKLSGVPTVERTALNTISDAIIVAEQALGDGQNLIANFQRLQAEMLRRKAPPN